jgi:hypothetical protein
MLQYICTHKIKLYLQKLFEGIEMELLYDDEVVSFLFLEIVSVNILQKN